MLPDLFTQDFGSFRVFLAFDFQIKLGRTVCVKGIETIRNRRFVPPVLIDPEPMIGVFANERLKLVPAGLGNFLVGAGGREAEPRQNTDQVAAIFPGQSHPRDNWISGSLMQESGDLRYARLQA